jgi:hypothetical protein
VNADDIRAELASAERALDRVIEGGPFARIDAEEIRRTLLLLEREIAVLRRELDAARRSL